MFNKINDFETSGLLAIFLNILERRDDTENRSQNSFNYPSDAAHNQIFINIYFYLRFIILLPCFLP